MSVMSFLRNLFNSRKALERETEDEEEAYIENALRENNRVFAQVLPIKEHGRQANEKLAEAIKRARGPFVDLENLMKQRRDVQRKG